MNPRLDEAYEYGKLGNEIKWLVFNGIAAWRPLNLRQYRIDSWSVSVHWESFGGLPDMLLTNHDEIVRSIALMERRRWQDYFVATVTLESYPKPQTSGKRKADQISSDVCLFPSHSIFSILKAY